MREHELAVLDNIERYLLDGPVTDVLAECGIKAGTVKEAKLKIKVQQAFVQGAELGDDLALLGFLDSQTDGLGPRSTAAQAKLLGVAGETEKRACDTVRKIRSRVQRKESRIPTVYRNRLFDRFFKQIEMPNQVAEWANGMTAAVQYLHEAFDGQSDVLLPKLSPLWFASAYLALLTPNWFQPFRDGSVKDAFAVGQRHVENAAVALEADVKASLTHGALLYRMCDTYGKAIALALHFLQQRRGGES
ncbi:MAG: hypothetical protein H8E44_43045 [Planctomycetes bacterium]|nr:hypothetical protein [Planctomycetota bacterium]MBL7040150.1 hypothetical protein [Pirellulaceae bacterium]